MATGDHVHVHREREMHDGSVHKLVVTWEKSFIHTTGSRRLPVQEPFLMSLILP